MVVLGLFAGEFLWAKDFYFFFYFIIGCANEKDLGSKSSHVEKILDASPDSAKTPFPKVDSEISAPTKAALKGPLLVIGDSSLMHAKDPLFKLLLGHFSKDEIFIYSVCGSGVQHWLKKGAFTEKICGHRLIEPSSKALKRIHRLETLIDNISPKLVAISLGTNNFATPRESVESNYRELYKISTGSQSRCLHFGPWAIERSDVKKALPNFYSYLQNIVKETSCLFFDMRTVAHASKKLNESLDDLHLKPGGTQEKKFVEFIVQKISETSSH